MNTETEREDPLKIFADKTPVPPRARSRWRPQMTLGSLILLVMLVAMVMAFFVNNYSKKQEIEALKKAHETRLNEQVDFFISAMEAVRFITRSPSQSSFGAITVYSENAYGSSKNDYAILLYLDPEKDYLLHHATQDIPATGTPTPQKTFHIKAVGDQQHSRNFVRFHVFFKGTGYHYQEDSQPFEGEIGVMSYFTSFSNAGRPGLKSDGIWGPQPALMSGPLKINKDKQVRDWINLLLPQGEQNWYIRPDTPTQLIRIRTNQADPEPCPGVMLWIEELGNSSVPETALPFSPKR